MSNNFFDIEISYLSTIEKIYYFANKKLIERREFGYEEKLIERREFALYVQEFFRYRD
jgi:hypothetical protein